MILLNDWKDCDASNVFGCFDIEPPDGVEILLASYGQDGYEGDAFILFRKDGKLYEVNGGHCSCYGLEGQWEPEETSIEALRHRIVNGKCGSSYCGNEYGEELTKLLDSLS